MTDELEAAVIEWHNARKAFLQYVDDLDSEDEGRFVPSDVSRHFTDAEEQLYTLAGRLLAEQRR